MRAPLGALFVLLTFGCSDGGAGASSAAAASATTAAPPRASASQAAAPAQPSAASSATAAPSATAAAFEASEEPALDEWAKSKVVKVPGSTANDCETRMVREWLRVMCVPRNAELGKPVKITVERGRAPKERSKGENLKAVNDITTLIVPVRPGLDFAASFDWEKGSHGLRVSWPAGSPESDRVMEFDNAPAPDAAPAASGGAPPTPPPADAPKGPKPEEPLEDVAGLATVPDDATWDAAAEVAVKGSTAAGCETKVSGDWFRARCKGTKEIVPLKGHRKTQTTTKVEGETATFSTPYVEGTEMHARFVLADGSKFLVLRWPKGPKPKTVGAFETGN